MAEADVDDGLNRKDESKEPSEPKRVSLQETEITEAPDTESVSSMWNFREWSPLSSLMWKIPERARKNYSTFELKLTCVDAADQFIVLGTNIGLVYWYNRQTDLLERFKEENSLTPISCVHLVSSEYYMLAIGMADGTMMVYQIPKIGIGPDGSVYKQCEHYPEGSHLYNLTNIKRYKIEGLHKNSVTSLHWSSDGKTLFSGDESGSVCQTSILIDKVESKSTGLLDEKYKIVQLSLNDRVLIVSSVFRSVLYDLDEKTSHQIGSQPRKIMGDFGAIFSGDDEGHSLWCSRPSLRLWKCDEKGVVQNTLMFKGLMSEQYPYIPVLNSKGIRTKSLSELQFGPLLYSGCFIVTYSKEILYILDVKNIKIVGICQELESCVDVAVNKEEIFVLESTRSLVRISSHCDPFASNSEVKPNPSFSFLSDLKSLNIHASNLIPKDSVKFFASKVKESSRVLPKMNSSIISTLKEVFESDIEYHNGEYQVKSTAIPMRGTKVDVAMEAASRSRHEKHNNDEVGGDSPDRKEHFENEAGASPASSTASKFDHISNLPYDDIIVENKKRKNRRKDKSKNSCIASMTESFTSTYSDNLSSKSISENGLENSMVSWQLEGESMCNSYSTSDIPLFPTVSASELALKEELLAKKLNWPELLPTSPSGLFSFDSEKPSTGANTNENLNEQGHENESMNEAGDSLMVKCNGTDEKYLDPFEESSKTEPSQDTYSEEGVMRQECSQDKSHESLQNIHDIDEHEDSVLEFSDIYTKYRSKLNSLEEIFEKEGGALTLKSQLKEQSSIDEGIENFSDVTYQGNSAGNKFNSFCEKEPEEEFFIAEMGSHLMSSSDNWLHYNVPSRSVSSIAVCENYIVFIESKTSVYYSQLGNVALKWEKAPYTAEEIAISSSGGQVFAIQKGSLNGLMSPSSASPTSLLSEDSPFIKIRDDIVKVRQGLDHIWAVDTSGSVLCLEFTNGTCKIESIKKFDIPHHAVVDITVKEWSLWALTDDGKVFYRDGFSMNRQFGICWKKRENLKVGAVSCISHGPGDSMWITNVRGELFFLTGITLSFPGGNSNIWQVCIGDLLYPNKSQIFGQGFQRSMKTSIASIKNKIDWYRPDKILGRLMMASFYGVCSIDDTVFFVTQAAEHASLFMNKHQIIGHSWDPFLKANKKMINRTWRHLCASSLFDKQGTMWLLDVKGKIFKCLPSGDCLEPIDKPTRAEQVNCIASAPEAFWILTSNGNVYGRTNIGAYNAAGFGWSKISLAPLENPHFVHISLGSDVCWACDNQGQIYIRIGSLSPPSVNDIHPAWVPVELETVNDKGSFFTKVYVSPNGRMVWAIDNCKCVYVREAVYPDLKIGLYWTMVPDIEALQLALSDVAVWALTHNGEIYRRCGITATNFIGDCWRRVPGEAIEISVTSNDELLALNSQNLILSHLDKLLTIKMEKKERESTESSPSRLKEGEEDWEIL